MTYIGHTDFLIEVQKGNVAGHSIVHKFGRNPDVDTGTDPEDVWNTGGLWVPQSSADTLNVVSGSSSDAVGNGGATKLYIEGLDSAFDVQSETITLTGTSPVTTANSYIRVYRAYVAEQEQAYGTGSNIGVLTATYTSGGDTAFTIAAGVGQTEIAIYTIPNAKTGYLMQATVHVDTRSSRTARVAGYQYRNADDASSAYTGARRRFATFDGIAGSIDVSDRGPKIFPAKTDIIWTVEEVSANDTAVSVDFELLLVDD